MIRIGEGGPDPKRVKNVLGGKTKIDMYVSGKG
jgi:hypothetical protein